MSTFGRIVVKKRALMLGIMLFLGVVSASVAGAVVAPDQVIKTTTDALQVALKSNHDQIKQDKTILYGLVSEYVLPNFDFESMSRLALGKNWREASEQQRAEFVDEFRTLLVNTYAIALAEYSDHEVDILPLQARDDDRQVTVKTSVRQPGGVPIPMYYKLLLKTDQWKVYDVVVDGVSLVTNYRTAFSQEMRKGGVDAVLANLKLRNAKHQSGAVEEPTKGSPQ